MTSIRVYHGTLQGILPLLPDNSVDSIVCDPPYNLDTIAKRFGASNAAACQNGTDGAFKRSSAGFMGQQWDNDVAFDVETWRHIIRVLKPGSMLIAFSHARTYHRMVTAIEAAGFEIRDQIMWLYGSGFPKAHDIDHGWKTALKPAHEPICVARKPLDGTNKANREKWGVGGFNIEGCRVPTDDAMRTQTNNNIKGDAYNSDTAGRERDTTFVPSADGRFPANPSSPTGHKRLSTHSLSRKVRVRSKEPNRHH